MESQKRTKIEEVEKGCYRIDLKKGQEITLYQGDTKPDFVIVPMVADPEKTNHFGII